MAKDDTDIVSALSHAVADKVGQRRFDLWFGAGTRFELDGRRLTIVVPNLFFQQWLRSNFCGHIESACQQTLGCRPTLQFRVDPALPAPHSEPSGSPGGNGEAKTVPSGGPGPAVLGAAAGLPDSAETTVGHANRAVPRRRAADLESFVVGPSNRLAYAALESVLLRPGEISPVLIHGPTAVGKTHLLEATQTAVRKQYPGLTVIYLSAEQFTTGFLEALRGSGLPSFRRKYRGVDLLLLDDLHFFSGKRCTQIELLYTVDALLRQGRQLVFAAARPPQDLCDLGPELMTRLASGIVCRVEPPDYETRLGIVGQMARRLGMHLPGDVQQYVASHLTNHARELSGALCRLHAASRAWEKPITLKMAEEALAELIRSSTRMVRLADIDKAVCETLGLEPKALHASGKAKATAHPRMLAMWLARRYTRSALSEISSYFGRRSHTTVLSAEKRIDGWRADGKSLELAHRTYSVNEAIQEVERRLRTG